MIPQGGDILGITQGEGQGYAQKFAPSSFDPVSFMEGLNAENKERSRQRLAVELENKKQAREYRKNLLELPDKINDFSRTPIIGIAEKTADELARLEQQGVDIEGSPEGRKLLAKTKAGFQSVADAGAEIASVAENYRKMAAEGKISAKKLTEWSDRLLALNDGTEQGLFAGLKYVRENTPYKKVFDPSNLVNDILKYPTVQEKLLGSGMTEKTTGLSREEIRETMAEGIDQAEIQDPDAIQNYFEEGVESGKFKDYEGMIDFMTDYAESLSQNKKELEGSVKSPGGNINFNVGGYSAPENVSVAGKPYINPKDGKVAGNGELYEVSVKLKGKDLAPMEVVDRNGKITYFKPSQYYKVTPGLQSGLPAGSWAVKGQVYGRPGEERIKEGESPEDAKARIMNLYPDAEIVPKGDGVSFTVYKPLKTDVISYDKNDIRFKTALEGFDIYEYEQGWNKANAGKTTGKTTGAKSQVTDVSDIFGGQ